MIKEMSKENQNPEILNCPMSLSVNMTIQVLIIREKRPKVIKINGDEIMISKGLIELLMMAKTKPANNAMKGLFNLREGKIKKTK